MINSFFFLIFIFFLIFFFSQETRVYSLFFKMKTQFLALRSQHWEVTLRESFWLMLLRMLAFPQSCRALRGPFHPQTLWRVSFVEKLKSLSVFSLCLFSFCGVFEDSLPSEHFLLLMLRRLLWQNLARLLEKWKIREQLVKTSGANAGQCAWPLGGTVTTHAFQHWHRLHGWKISLAFCFKTVPHFTTQMKKA